MKWSSHALATLLCLLNVSLQSAAFSWPNWGRCPDVKVQKNFKLFDYQGWWYDQAGYRTEAVEGDKRCVYTMLFLNVTDDRLYVKKYGIFNRDNQWGVIQGTANFTDPSKKEKEGKLTVSYKFGKESVPYWVLGTDFDTYSVVYTCENVLFFFHYYTVSFLSRQQTFFSTREEKEFFNKTNTVLISNGISTSNIQRANQSNCTLNKIPFM